MEFPPDFDVCAEQLLRRAIVNDPRWYNTNAVVGDCTPKCSIQHLTSIRLFKTATVTDWTVPVPSGGIHVCLPGTCPADSSLHVVDVTSLGRAHVSCATDGAYFCSQHMRLHVCSRECKQTMPTESNDQVCVMSGKRVVAALATEFHSGTMLIQGQLAHDLNARREERRRAQVHNRRDAVVVNEVFRAARMRSSSGASSSSYVDVDTPGDDIFLDTLEGNTFGDGVGMDLNTYYAKIYAVIQKLLTSNDRNRIEFTKRYSARQSTGRRITQYMQSTAVGSIRCLTTMYQLQDREVNTRYLTDQVLLPSHSMSRMFAYFTMVCIECHMNIVKGITAKETFNDEDLKQICLYDTLYISTIAHVIFFHMAKGCYLQNEHLIEQENLLLFPDANTLEQLGFPQRAFTDAEKTVTYCLRLARKNLQLREMQTTHLEPHQYLFGHHSVVVTFLEARRRRLVGLRANTEITN